MDPRALYYLPPPGQRANAFANFVHNYTATVSPYAMQTYAQWLNSMGPADGLLQLEQLVNERMLAREASLREARRQDAQVQSSRSNLMSSIVTARTNLARQRMASETDLAVARTERDTEAMKAGALDRESSRELLARGEAVVSQGRRALERASAAGDARGVQDALDQTRRGLLAVRNEAQSGMDGNELDALARQLNDFAYSSSVASGGGTGTTIVGDPDATAALLGVVNEVMGEVTGRDRREYGFRGANADAIINTSIEDALRAQDAGLGGGTAGLRVGGSVAGGGRPDTYITPDDLDMDALRDDLMAAQQKRERQLRELAIRQLAPGLLERRERQQMRDQSRAMADLGLEGYTPAEVRAALARIQSSAPEPAPPPAPPPAPQPTAEPQPRIGGNVGTHEVVTQAPAAGAGAMRPPSDTPRATPAPASRQRMSPDNRHVKNPPGTERDSSGTRVGGDEAGSREFVGPPDIRGMPETPPPARARRPRVSEEDAFVGPPDIRETGLTTEQALQLDKQVPSTLELNQMLRQMLAQQRAGEPAPPGALARLQQLQAARKLINAQLEREGMDQLQQFRDMAPAPQQTEAPPADPSAARGAPPPLDPSRMLPRPDYAPLPDMTRLPEPPPPDARDAWPDLDIRPLGSRAPQPPPPDRPFVPESSAERQQRMMTFHGTDLPRTFNTSDIQVPEIEPPQPPSMLPGELERERQTSAQGQLLMQLMHGQDAKGQLTEQDRLSTSTALANEFADQLRRIQEERRRLGRAAAGPSGAGTALRPTE